MCTCCIVYNHSKVSFKTLSGIEQVEKRSLWTQNNSSWLRCLALERYCCKGKSNCSTCSPIFLSFQYIYLSGFKNLTHFFFPYVIPGKSFYTRNSQHSPNALLSVRVILEYFFTCMIFTWNSDAHIMNMHFCHPVRFYSL